MECSDIPGTHLFSFLINVSLVRGVGTWRKRKAVFHSSEGSERSVLHIKHNNLRRVCQPNLSVFFRILVVACDLKRLPRIQPKEEKYPNPGVLNREVVCGFHGIASEVLIFPAKEILFANNESPKTTSAMKSSSMWFEYEQANLSTRFHSKRRK